MLEKYRATIHGNTIEWDGEAPDGVEGEIRVDVTVVSKSRAPRKGDGAKAAAALQKIAEHGELAKAIPDPDAWLREIRKDRPLPGRD